MALMITSAQLAEALRGVSVAELARQTGIAEKTIYRLRNQANDPSLGTVERLLAGIDRIKGLGSHPNVPKREAGAQGSTGSESPLHLIDRREGERREANRHDGERRKRQAVQAAGGEG